MSCKLLALKRRCKLPLTQKLSFYREGKDKTGKNINNLNLTGNSRLCSHKFNKEQINTDCETSGDPACFFWNNLHSTVAPTGGTPADVFKAHFKHTASLCDIMGKLTKKRTVNLNKCGSSLDRVSRCLKVPHLSDNYMQV